MASSQPTPPLAVRRGRRKGKEVRMYQHRDAIDPPFSACSTPSLPLPTPHPPSPAERISDSWRDLLEHGIDTASTWDPRASPMTPTANHHPSPRPSPSSSSSSRPLISDRVSEIVTQMNDPLVIEYVSSPVSDHAPVLPRPHPLAPGLAERSLGVRATISPEIIFRDTQSQPPSSSPTHVSPTPSHTQCSPRTMDDPASPRSPRPSACVCEVRDSACDASEDAVQARRGVALDGLTSPTPDVELGLPAADRFSPRRDHLDGQESPASPFSTAERYVTIDRWACRSVGTQTDVDRDAEAVEVRVTPGVCVHDPCVDVSQARSPDRAIGRELPCAAPLVPYSPSTPPRPRDDYSVISDEPLPADRRHDASWEHFRVSSEERRRRNRNRRRNRRRRNAERRRDAAGEDARPPAASQPIPPLISRPGPRPQVTARPQSPPRVSNREQDDRVRLPAAPAPLLSAEEIAQLRLLLRRGVARDNEARHGGERERHYPPRFQTVLSEVESNNNAKRRKRRRRRGGNPVPPPQEVINNVNIPRAPSPVPHPAPAFQPQPPPPPPAMPRVAWPPHARGVYPLRPQTTLAPVHPGTEAPGWMQAAQMPLPPHAQVPHPHLPLHSAAPWIIPYPPPNSAAPWMIPHPPLNSAAPWMHPCPPPFPAWCGR
ncbi:actin cytoskeleton-regulatory complex protein PAN1-like [Ischnura elegans]|uniref:actin cytoskeleton-regulatory complex protein PAN1-like n=1 Tax=Ischnura elegans TaxID=197161 RepID=UPI001ED891B4|nr:actin cytoskeleton-regulatory complex protein PAN1-like [Ischnura elegans]